MDILFQGTPVWAWIAFLAFVAALLVFDLRVLHRGARRLGVRESLVLSGLHVAVGLGFSFWIWRLLGERAALDYVAGYLVEKSLAVDNLFVIAVVFAHFGVPAALQHRVLVWGVLGVIVTRGLMIAAGAAALHRFDWLLLLFAGVLVATGLKMLTLGHRRPDVARNPVLNFLRRRWRVTEGLAGERFFVRRRDPDGGAAALWMTPLFLALVMIELTDILFAVESVPAIFAITREPYVVFTSSIFAIIGLKSLYFALAAMLHRFVYLQVALSLVLIFIGAKVLAAAALGIEKFPAGVSLAVVATLLAGGVALSLWRTRPAPAPGPAPATALRGAAPAPRAEEEA